MLHSYRVLRLGIEVVCIAICAKRAAFSARRNSDTVGDLGSRIEGRTRVETSFPQVVREMFGRMRRKPACGTRATKVSVWDEGAGAHGARGAP